MTAGNGNILAQIAMLGFIPFCIALFLLMRPIRAAAMGLVTGFLLLPNTSYHFSGLPDYDKVAAMTLGVLIAGLAVDSGRFTRFRPRWVDVPILMLILSNGFSSAFNGLGLWDAFSSIFQAGVRWGSPWFLGRIYFGDSLAQRELAKTIIGGALLYIPPCMLEVVISPILHQRIYGIALISIKHARRGSLWRPNVFIEHGLVCALFFGLATVMAFYLWRSRSVRSILGLPIGLVFFLLAMMTVGCSSSMALLVMVTGCTCIVLGRAVGFSLPLILMILLPPSYVAARQLLGWEGRELVQVSKAIFGEERGDSLFFRLRNENDLRERAQQKKWFGYSDQLAFTGNSANINRDDPRSAGEFIIVDSMWMWYMGLQGLFGVACLYSTLLLGAWLAWRYIPARYWGHPLVGMPLTFGLVCALYAQDTLLNAVENQLFVVVVGSTAGCLATRAQRRKLGLKR